MADKDDDMWPLGITGFYSLMGMMGTAGLAGIDMDMHVKSPLYSGFHWGMLGAASLVIALGTCATIYLAGKKDKTPDPLEEFLLTLPIFALLTVAYQPLFPYACIITQSLGSIGCLISVFMPGATPGDADNKQRLFKENKENREEQFFSIKRLGDSAIN